MTPAARAGRGRSRGSPPQLRLPDAKPHAEDRAQVVGVEREPDAGKRRPGVERQSGRDARAIGRMVVPGRSEIEEYADAAVAVLDGGVIHLRRPGGRDVVLV